MKEVEGRRKFKVSKSFLRVHCFSHNEEECNDEWGNMSELINLNLVFVCA
jgi:hypothetical protein